MENINLIAAKSQIEGLQRLVKKYERNAEICGECEESALYMSIAAKYSERIGKLRKLVAEKELAIVGKEVAL